MKFSAPSDSDDDDSSVDSFDAGTLSGESETSNDSVAAPFASKPGAKWRCDFCEEALFDAFDEVVEHERICNARLCQGGANARCSKESGRRAMSNTFSFGVGATPPRVFNPWLYTRKATEDSASIDDDWERVRPLKHVDSFELNPHDRCSFRRGEGASPCKKATLSQSIDTCSTANESLSDEDESKESESDESEPDDASVGNPILRRRDNPIRRPATDEEIEHALAIGFTDHLWERCGERGFTRIDFLKAVLYGCRCRDGHHRRFTYRGITAITDASVGTGITIFEQYDTQCAQCESEKDRCSCGFCKG